MKPFATLFLICSFTLFAACDRNQPSVDKIQLVLDWKAQMEHAGFFVAKQQGYYQEAGIEIEILEGNGAPTTARVVGNGTYNLGVSSGSATLIAREKGIPIVSLAVINQHSPVVVYSLASSNIQKPNDLVGKRIGVNIGGTKYREFQAFLKKQGIRESDIQLMGLPEASPAPLLAGQVDAMLGYTEDQPVTVELRGIAVNRITLSDYGIDVYSTNIIVYEAFLQKNPDLVRRFLHASLKGWKEAVEQPEKAVAAYMAARPESNAAFNQANFKALAPILTSSDVQILGVGAQTMTRWADTQDILSDLGLLTQEQDLSKIFTNEFLPTQ